MRRRARLRDLGDFYRADTIDAAFVACRTSRSHLIDDPSRACAVGALDLVNMLKS